jgi:uncharacterized coiled-coil protein SlyX
MNEIDLKTKIEGLEKAIQEHKADANRYEDQLKETTQQLKDYNKPELTATQMDDVYEAVEKAVNSYDFSDTDNYEIDYGIDYDGRINCESHEFINESDLVQMIVDKVCTLFKEVEELDTTEDDNHKPVE